MHHKKIIAGLLLLYGWIFAANAQNNNCSCLWNLNYMELKIRENYAGYTDKVNKDTRVRHELLLDSLRHAAATAATTKACHALLEKYRLFFYDRHLQLSWKDMAKKTAEGGKGNNDPQKKNEVEWRVLPSGTLYIRLASCKLYNKPILDSLINANKERLKRIDKWIVDVRGNTGGATDVFSGLLPYIYTKPYISAGDAHWLTTDVAGKLDSFLSKSGNLLDSGTRNRAQRWLQIAKENPNTWFVEKGDTLSFDTVLPYPRRIAILSDKENGSSGETFLIVAKGSSDKVTIFGQNSAGYLDYGDLLRYPLPCPSFVLAIPSRRANYLDKGVSYDKNGYPPDVYIKDDNTDWIGFVQQYWRKSRRGE